MQKYIGFRKLKQYYKDLIKFKIIRARINIFKNWDKKTADYLISGERV